MGRMSDPRDARDASGCAARPYGTARGIWGRSCIYEYHSFMTVPLYDEDPAQHADTGEDDDDPAAGRADTRDLHGRPQSAFAPERFTSSPHLTISALRYASNSSGVEVLTVLPRAVMCLRTSSDSAARLMP